MSKYKTLILWKARILGALAIMFFLYVLISVKASPDTGEFNMPFNSMMLLLGFATLGYIFAWFREKEGGIIMIVAGCIMGMYMYYNGGSSDTNIAVAVIASCLPSFSTVKNTTEQGVKCVAFNKFSFII